MSYTKQNFKSGEVLLASQLNAMDSQIYDNDNNLGDLKLTLKTYLLPILREATYQSDVKNLIDTLDDLLGGPKEKEIFTFSKRYTTSYINGSNGVDASDSANPSTYVTTNQTSKTGGTLVFEYDEESFNIFDCNIFLFDSNGDYLGYRVPSVNGTNTQYPKEYELHKSDVSKTATGFSQIANNKTRITIPNDCTIKMCMRKYSGTVSPNGSIDVANQLNVTKYIMDNVNIYVEYEV